MRQARAVAVSQCRHVQVLLRHVACLQQTHSVVRVLSPPDNASVAAPVLQPRDHQTQQSPNQGQRHVWWQRSQKPLRVEAGTLSVNDAAGRRIVWLSHAAHAAVSVAVPAAAAVVLSLCRRAQEQLQQRQPGVR